MNGRAVALRGSLRSHLRVTDHLTGDAISNDSKDSSVEILQLEGYPMQPVVRVSILRCAPENFAELRRMMIEADAVLRPGVEALPGLISFYAGADEATSSLMNVSTWETLDHAKQLDTFQPMLDAGKAFVQAGATFERPIMNYATLWQLHGSASQ
jgi:hypothetical protein